MEDILLICMSLKQVMLVLELLVNYLILHQENILEKVQIHMEHGIMVLRYIEVNGIRDHS